MRVQDEFQRQTLQGHGVITLQGWDRVASVQLQASRWEVTQVARWGQSWGRVGDGLGPPASPRPVLWWKGQPQALIFWGPTFRNQWVCVGPLSQLRSGPAGVGRDGAPESLSLSSTCQVYATSLPACSSHGWPLLLWGQWQDSRGLGQLAPASFALLSSSRLAWAPYGHWAGSGGQRVP